MQRATSGIVRCASGADRLLDPSIISLSLISSVLPCSFSLLFLHFSFHFELFYRSYNTRSIGWGSVISVDRQTGVLVAWNGGSILPCRTTSQRHSVFGLAVME